MFLQSESLYKSRANVKFSKCATHKSLVDGTSYVHLFLPKRLKTVSFFAVGPNLTFDIRLFNWLRFFCCLMSNRLCTGGESISDRILLCLRAGEINVFDGFIAVVFLTLRSESAADSPLRFPNLDLIPSICIESAFIWLVFFALALLGRG